MAIRTFSVIISVENGDEFSICEALDLYNQSSTAGRLEWVGDEELIEG